jgi:hypothetical protein
VGKITAHASRFLLNIDALPIYPSPTEALLPIISMGYEHNGPFRVSSGWRLKSAGSGWMAI